MNHFRLLCITFIAKFIFFFIVIVSAVPTFSATCSGSVMVTAYDFESGLLGSNPEWGLICYKVSITARGLPEPSFLQGSTLGTRAAEHKGCNWGMQID